MSFDSQITDLRGSITQLERVLIERSDRQDEKLASIERQTILTNGRVNGHDRLFLTVTDTLDRIKAGIDERTKTVDDFMKQISFVLWVRANWKVTLAILVPVLAFLGWGLEKGYIEIHPGGRQEVSVVLPATSR